MITKTLGPQTSPVRFRKILLLKTESYRAVKKKRKKELVPLRQKYINSHFSSVAKNLIKTCNDS